VMPAPSVQPLQYGGYAGPRSGTVVPTYLSRQSMGLGVTLVVCGALAIIFNGVAIGVHDSLSYVGHGIWVGILLLIAGSFGITSAVHKTKCLIVSFMVFSILTSVMTVSLLALGIAGAVSNACSKSCYGYGCGSGSYRHYDFDNYYYYHDYTPPCSDKIRAAVAMEALLAIIALVSGIACLWGSVIGCKAVCCCGYNATFGMPVVYTTPYNQSMVVYSQQQTGPPYFARPQIMPTSLPTAPPPYVSTGYAVQYWSQQQPAAAAPNFAGYTVPPAAGAFDPAQLPVTSLNMPPPAYTAIGEMPPDNKL
jgi:hypothetical protein